MRLSTSRSASWQSFFRGNIETSAGSFLAESGYSTLLQVVNLNIVNLWANIAKRFILEKFTICLVLQNRKNLRQKILFLLHVTFDMILNLSPLQSKALFTFHFILGKSVLFEILFWELDIRYPLLVIQTCKVWGDLRWSGRFCVHNHNYGAAEDGEASDEEDDENTFWWCLWTWILQRKEIMKKIEYLPLIISSIANFIPGK